MPIPALHGTFLPQRFLCCAQIQGQNCGENAQGDPRTGEQEGFPREGESRCGRAESDEAEGGRQEGRGSIEETLTYCDFPSEHWTRIRTNNVIERLNREIRRRTRVVGTFPDGNSALMLACARLRHAAGTQWGNKKYMNMKHLEAALYDASIAG